MTDFVLKLVGQPRGEPTVADGRYVVHYDPRLDAGGVYTLETTSDLAAAKRFASGTEALRYYRQVCPNHPEDSPGHPNRPLTAFSVQLVPVP